MTETEPAALAVTDGIAVAGIANPPANAFGAAVRAGLLDAVRRAASGPAMDGAVIAAQGKIFIASAEIAES